MTDRTGDRDLETPEADATEQAATVVPGWPDEEPAEAPARTHDIEAPDWDADEQRRVVEFDDDYDR